MAFEVAGETHIGILHTAIEGRVGVVIVVGGPQYRVGSHRLFVELARSLAAHGVAVLRFDLQGMGDSSGAEKPFWQRMDEIEAAIALLRQKTSVCKVALLGLCDAASASMIYAQRNEVDGLMLLNPWVRNDQSESKARLKHYYLRRLLDKQFWRKVVSGRFHFFHSLLNFVFHIKTSVKKPLNDDDYRSAMLAGMQAFTGKACIVLSGHDLVAREFQDLVSAHPRWAQRLAQSNIEMHHVLDADHTFASRQWKRALCDRLVAWCQAL